MGLAESDWRTPPPPRGIPLLLLLLLPRARRSARIAAAAAGGGGGRWVLASVWFASLFSSCSSWLGLAGCLSLRVFFFFGLEFFFFWLGGFFFWAVELDLIAEATREGGRGGGGAPQRRGESLLAPGLSLLLFAVCCVPVCVYWSVISC